MGRDRRSRAAEEVRPSCPNCGSILAPGALLCVDCGYHLGHRKVMRTQDAASEPPDPTRAWLYAALGTAVLGAGALALLVWFLSGPPSIVGRWAGHPRFAFAGLFGFGDEITVTFHKDGTVRSSDGGIGTYSIKGDVLRVRFEKRGEDDSDFEFQSKFHIERNVLTIDHYPASAEPMNFHLESRDIASTARPRRPPSRAPKSREARSSPSSK